MVTGVVPSPPRFLPSVFIAHRVQHSHCSSIFHRVLLTHALALSASQFVHKKKPQRIYTRMHSAGLELTKLTYTRLEDNLIRHWGDLHGPPRAQLRPLGPGEGVPARDRLRHRGPRRGRPGRQLRFLGCPPWVRRCPRLLNPRQESQSSTTTVDVKSRTTGSSYCCSSTAGLLLLYQISSASKP